jgi:heme/copper-type cytochrome/quinol oxidase subunit 4
MNQITLRIIGFTGSLVLTLLAYFMIVSPHLFHLMPTQVIPLIVILAILQSIIQLIFFLLWREKSGYWNLIFYVSTVGIIFVIIFFSIWIMDTLNYRMM